MKTIVLANQKGGVGKSAIARLLAHYLVRQGQRVLAIDLDHQGNLTDPIKLSGKASVAEVSSYHLFFAAPLFVPEGDLVLIPSDSDGLLSLEKQESKHNSFATCFRAFLRSQVGRFDVCIIDTNPNPDIRVQSALVSCNFVLSPIQLNQEAINGIAELVNHKRVGIHRIKQTLNPAIELIGILPTLVEPTPFQRKNFAQISTHFSHLLIKKSTGSGFAAIPKRSVIAETQASGEVLWELQKTAARNTWKEIEPTLRTIALRMGVEGKENA